MRRDKVVIGGSAGCLEALVEILKPLPADLGAALFVVVHVPEDHSTALPQILSRAGALDAVLPTDGERITSNCVYIAPPNRHMQLEEDRIRLVFGPRENRARPAINPLFRSAARSFSSRVIGIILSGTLDDGAYGLAQVKRLGGIAIVQDPSDAAFPGMPRRALEETQIDYCVPASEIGGLVASLVQQPISDEGKEVVDTDSGKHFVGITCPECHGPIFTDVQEGSLNYSCIVGHRYAPEVMRVEHSRRMEDALWSAVASLREHANLLINMAQSIPTRAEMLREEAHLKQEHARELEALIERFAH